ncbi:Aste57867_2076 [Aphanomyces stellatus]|uniref:Aste57867_2076 protein n=1 Tax=Aphanomyces stellatus TaxID=120398 RepID=A0A485KAD5_9STRA|nr:hypothetical protein As57867_002072 [Aphanomyces stellatus]VFT79279.1 Aste57867_2076 [Aphanomyces stellatus]
MDQIKSHEFFQMNCPHGSDQLFHASYLRYLILCLAALMTTSRSRSSCQNKGLKVIRYVSSEEEQNYDRFPRCFPHCCPQHTEYRGCGASLSLRFATGGMDATTFFAFGRFEVASENPLEEGHLLPWTAFTNDLRRPTASTATWLQGQAGTDELWAGVAETPETLSEILPTHFFYNFHSKQWSTQREVAMDLIWQWLYTFGSIHRSMYDQRNIEKNGCLSLLYDAVTQMLANQSENLVEYSQRILSELGSHDQNTIWPVNVDALLAQFYEKLREPRNIPQEVKMKFSDATFNGLWILKSVCMRRLDLQISILNYIRFATMCFGLHLSLGEADNGTQVKSDLVMFAAPSSTFRLDGKLNVVEVLPNGEPVDIYDSGVLYGDYIGWLEFSTIQLWMYLWPVHNRKHANLLRLCMSRDIQNELTMRIAFTLEESGPIESDINFQNLPRDERSRHWNDAPHIVVMEMDAEYARQ